MPEQAELWIGLVELKPLNREEYGAAGAFTNIITWACNATEFRKKAEIIAATMNLYVLEVEGEEPLAKRAENGPLSITSILSTRPHNPTPAASTTLSN